MPFIALRCMYRLTHHERTVANITFTASNRAAAQPLRDFLREQRQEALKQDALARRQVQVAQASANAGRLVPAANVEAMFAARRAATLEGIQGAAASVASTDVSR